MVTEATPLVGSCSGEQTRRIDTGSSSNDNEDESIASLRKARRLLYTSHFFAQFSQQSWEFGLTLFLAAITDYNNLFLVASYGIVTGLVVFATGSSAGRYFVDNSDWNRISSAQFLIWTQNGCVMLATALSYALLITKQKQTNSKVDADLTSNWKRSILEGIPLDFFSIILIIGLHIFGPMSTVLDKAFIVSIERDWVVVMGEYARNLKLNESSLESKQQETWLYETNVFMKQIDLSCRIAAPSFAGFIIGMAETYGVRNKAESLAVTALLIGLLNGAALVVEYICTARIYRLVPTLAVKHTVRAAVATTTSEIKSSNDPMIKSASSNATKTTLTVNSISLQLPAGLRVYLSQPISSAGISLALL
jgi:Ferroportin1 (FPN1)